jgi:putative hydrolase of HD superfamily
MDGFDLEPVVRLLLQANRLKVTPRSGWATLGLNNAESVADHTFDVAFIALVLAELIDEPVDREKVLTIALIHDLPESATGDIPSPAMRYFPAGAKRHAEQKAMAEILEGFEFGRRLQRWWQEFEDRSSVEGRLVRDADRIGLFLQVLVYERTSANQYLEEFWESQAGKVFEFPISQKLYERLEKGRDTKARRDVP